MQRMLRRAVVFSLLGALAWPALPSSRGEDLIILDDSAFEYEVPAPIFGEPEAAPLATPFETLSRGMSGEGVVAIQTRLTELGYYHGKISGDFLDGTDSATRSFQSKNGLASNGKVTATTWNALMNANAIGKDELPHPLDAGAYTGMRAYVEPEATPHPGATQAAATPVPVTGFTYQRKLEYGAQGDDVRMLQQRLRDLGYFDMDTGISGNFYQHTYDAVRVFQRNNGLSVDGIAGEDTQRYLWDASLALDAQSPPRPAPTPEPLRYMLKVDVTNQVTSAYELDAYGQYTVLVRQMICSTGTEANPTPLKTTQSKGKRARWGYFPEWDSHAQYLTRIDSSNAFHSVLYSEPNTQALVVSAYNALGKRASHGCVRLLVADAQWIYDNCPNGTTITVYEGEPDPELTEMLKPPPLDRSVMLPQVTPLPTPPPVWDPSATPPPYRLMRKGASGEDVWWLQTKLTQLGYYRGTVSGGYYDGTAAAVKAFQRDAGLSADGIAGPATLKKLYEDPAYARPVNGGVPQQQTAAPGQLIPVPQFPATVTPSPTPTSVPTPTPPPSGGQPSTVAPSGTGQGVWITPPPPPAGFEG